MNEKLKKVVGYVLPVFILLGFLLFLASGPVIKRNTESGQAINRLLHEDLQKEIKQSSWDDALQYLTLTEKNWASLGPKIETISEKDDIYRFNMGIAKLKGYIATEDKPSALAELNLLKVIWSHIGK